MNDFTALPDEELNVMLAELMGWKKPNPNGYGENPFYRDWVCPQGKVLKDRPNYTASLDDVAKVECGLTTEYSRYIDNLNEVVRIDNTWRAICASPRQRTIALVATLQK